jgi:hypothetical protein
MQLTHEKQPVVELLFDALGIAEAVVGTILEEPELVGDSIFGARVGEGREVL